MKELPTKEQKRIAELAEQVYSEVNELARNQDSYDFGLPMFEKETGPIEKALTAEALRAMPLVEALDSICNSPLPANEREMISWIATARSIADKALSSYAGGADTGDVELNCMVCGKSFFGPKPQMCCSGRECGCMGQPVNGPFVCSKECSDNYKPEGFATHKTVGLTPIQQAGADKKEEANGR